ncbi:hypothetical protein AQI88_17225 [Streptomyces cellostaticus]|uniref:Uncharacterized protein n=1 Tax=Streptomyces cellostaticus TaxID=67285 RepID=A0A101NLZ3_9ACTN|nr:hypothetical protein [Streptomyces cellostaticus]KUM95442.1 hypothetical protein AQI88_17225 [Streptomyces cellostaticus]GHI01912.1 hypothetical protein Scel_02330 [Streptomyces cellostaticus]
MTPITGLDLTGFTAREPGVWTDAAGLVLTVHFFPLVPDLPAPLHEFERLRTALAAGVGGRGGGLIEAVPGAVDGVPAVRQLIKVRLPGAAHGQGFLGSWTIPKAGCSTVLKVQAAEGGMTGVREAMVMNQVGMEAYFRPHPYSAGGQFGGLPYHVGDDEQWDAGFPDHPLTLVRAALHRITPTVTLDEHFKQLPPFAGPAAQPPHPAPAPPPPPPPFGAPPAAAPPKRGWFRRGGGH